LIIAKRPRRYVQDGCRHSGPCRRSFRLMFRGCGLAPGEPAVTPPARPPPALSSVAHPWCCSLGMRRDSGEGTPTGLQWTAICQLHASYCCFAVASAGWGRGERCSCTAVASNERQAVCHVRGVVSPSASPSRTRPDRRCDFYRRDGQTIKISAVDPPNGRVHAPNYAPHATDHP
jgi:hypothetical protein